MSANERSFMDVMQDILRNVQEIVRSEVRLAKTELREEVVKAKTSGVLLGAGSMAAIYSVLFLLLMAMFALMLVMPSWAAALTVAAVLAIFSTVALSAGLKRMKQITPAPPRTVETIKENVEWVKQQTK